MSSSLQEDSERPASSEGNDLHLFDVVPLNPSIDLCRETATALPFDVTPQDTRSATTSFPALDMPVHWRPCLCQCIEAYNASYCSFLSSPVYHTSESFYFPHFAHARPTAAELHMAFDDAEALDLPAFFIPPHIPNCSKLPCWGLDSTAMFWGGLEEFIEVRVSSTSPLQSLINF